MRRRAAAALLLAVATVAAACDSPTVPPRESQRPYDFTLASGAGPLVLRWPTGSTIRVYAVPGPDEDRSAVLRAGLDHAVRVWNAAALYGEFQVQAASAVHDADVVLGWADVPLPVATLGCSPGAGGAAVTTFCLADGSDPPRLRPFPIQTPDGPVIGRPRMVILVRPSEAGDPMLVRRLVAHEIGHVLGIGRHSPVAGDLMWSGPLAADEPTAADRATLRILYQTTPDIHP